MKKLNNCCEKVYTNWTLSHIFPYHKTEKSTSICQTSKFVNVWVVTMLVANTFSLQILSPHFTPNKLIKLIDDIC